MTDTKAMVRMGEYVLAATELRSLILIVCFGLTRRNDSRSHKSLPDILTVARTRIPGWAPKQPATAWPRDDMSVVGTIKPSVCVSSCLDGRCLSK